MIRKEVLHILLINRIDVEEVALNIKYSSPWNNGAGMLSFEYPVEKAARFDNGSVVIFRYDGEDIFYGWLFKSIQDKKVIKCTCYDQLRYLKAKNTIMRQIEPLDTFLNKVCASFGDRLRMGRVDSTEAMLGKYFFDNQTHLDMLYQSIKDNLLLNGYHYTLRDNFGALELRDTLDLRLPLIIGDGSLATDYSYARSIDDDTYNYIKVARDDEKAGVRNTFIAEDSVGIKKWGKLMLYDKVSAELNAVQLADRAARLLALKNRETETLTVECMGDIRVMGGSGVCFIAEAAELDLWAVVSSATHSFGRSQHTMKLELTFGRWT